MAEATVATALVYGLGGAVANPLDAAKTRTQYAASFDRQQAGEAEVRNWLLKKRGMFRGLGASCAQALIGPAVFSYQFDRYKHHGPL